MLRVKKVEYLNGYKLKIAFSNGKVKIVDFETWIAEDNFYLKPLREIQYFKKVRLDDCKYSICWPNGADFSPDVLYQAGHELLIKRKKSRLRSKKTAGPSRKLRSAKNEKK